MSIFDTWRMRGGHPIEVKTMTSKHIRNCIKMLEEIKKTPSESRAFLEIWLGYAPNLLDVFKNPSLKERIIKTGDKTLILELELNEKDQMFLTQWIYEFKNELKSPDRMIKTTPLKK